MKKSLILLAFGFLWNFSAKAYLVPNDSNYKILKEKDFQYILPENQLEYFNLIKHYSDFITPIYEKDFFWKLDERTSIVLASDNNQIPNAFAMTSPNNLTVYYSGGVEFLESSATSSWLYVLSTHERAHIYQLNVKQHPYKELKYIFGNDPVILIPFIPLPIFLSPNLFLPTFLVEGNAVLNESRFHVGGRLFSGESRALVAGLILDGKADLKYMMNDHIFFPFGNEKYLVGGYFQSYLASIYGVSLVDSFFSKNANRYLNPFYLKTSFAETFYQNYEALYSNFLEKMKNNFYSFQKAQGREIAFSISEVQFNKNLDGSKILFTTQETGKSRLFFNQLDSENLSLSKSETLLKSGKVFEITPGKFASVSSDFIDQTKYLYSLFDENKKSIKQFEGKYIHDMKSNNTSYFLMSKSIDTGELYLNDQFIAQTESKSFLDEAGNIYYFKQNGQERILFQNHKKLFSYKGFYGTLQEVISENEIYFVASSRNGSSLYLWNQGKIQKVLSADNIVRSLKLKDHFLVSALQSDGYHVYLIPNENKYIDELPEVYSYSHFDTQTSLDSESIAQKPTEATATSFSDYFSLTEMRFNRFAPSLYYDLDDVAWFNELSFIDPLFWSSLDMGFSLADKISYNYLTYQYTPYLVDIFTSLTNETWNTTNRLFPKYRTDTHLSLGFEYSLFSNAFHNLKTGLIFQDRTVGNKNYNNQKVYFEYSYSESYLLNYLPYRYFSIQPSAYKKDNSLIINVMTQASSYLGGDFYMSLGYNYYQEKFDTLAPSLNPKMKFKEKFPLLAFAPTLLIEQLEQHQLELLKEIPFSAYYYRFPISIRRVAPYLGYQENKSYDLKGNFLRESLKFFNVGLEIEALFFHRVPSRMRILNSEVTTLDKKENSIIINWNQEF